MLATARRARFAKFLECYHNSFAGDADGVFTHSPEYIAKVVEAAQGNSALAADALRLDPRLTSTDLGAVAFSVAKAVAEDKQLAPHFLDIELVESTMIVYFESKAEIEKAKKVLGECGRVGLIGSPGDRISDSVVSDLFIVTLEAAPAVHEAVVTEMKKKFPPFMKKGKSKDDKDSCDGDDKEKGGDPSADEKDGAKESYSPADECAALGLAEAVFGDEPLALCTAGAEGVRAAFADVYGAAALELALKAKIGESLAPEADDAAGQRNRLLRLLAARGHIAGGKAAGLGEALDKVVAEHVKASGVVEGKAFDEAADTLALALDAVVESADGIYTLFVERVLDTGAAALTPERTAALVAHLKEAAAKDEAAHARVVARCLRSIASVAMFERGAFRSAAVAEAVAAWSAYVAEATKPATAPVDPLAGVIDAMLSP